MAYSFLKEQKHSCSISVMRSRVEVTINLDPTLGLTWDKVMDPDARGIESFFTFSSK